MVNYLAHWVDLLRVPGTEGVDLLGSLTEDAMNQFLARHFQADAYHYTKQIQKEFNDGSQLRKFTLELNVASPLKLEFPPFSPGNPQFISAQGWNEIDHLPAGKRGALVTPNIRVTCDSIKFRVGWPNLQPPPSDWEWTPNALRMVAEAYVWMDQKDGRNRLLIEPVRVKFDTSSLLADLRLPSTPPPAPTTCEQKFNDLLVIVLNVGAYEFGPALVRAIELPILNVAGLPIVPSYLNLSNKLVTVGAGIDHVKAEKDLGEKTSKLIARYLSLLEEDLASQPRGSAILPESGRANGKPLTAAQIEKILSTKLVKSRAFVSALKANSQAHYRDLTTSKKHRRSAKATAPIPEGIGGAVNEYFVDSLLPKFFVASRDGGVEANLGFGKGGIRWWFRVGNPDATFNANDVTGSADVDVGGAIFACVKRFWDCSWSWECGEVSLSVVGRPSIKIKTSNVSDGIVITAEIKDKPRFSNSLPFPFNEVVNALGDVVVDAIVAIINVILSQIRIVVVGVELEIPNMKTKVALSGFNRFMFDRDPTAPAPLPTNKRRFLGVKAAFEAH